MRKIIMAVIAAAVIAAGLAAPMASATASSACQVGLWNGSSYGPPWGYEICGTTEQNFSFPGTTHESFVIGLNHAVWTTWTGQTTWHSMGGQACGSSNCGVYLLDEAPTIGVYGPQGTTGWCDARNSNGTWTGWMTGCLF